jgi:tetratricopeptide (TPR) repeat protein
MPGRTAGSIATLLERDAELHSIDQALHAAADGGGWPLVFEGPAGIGKTALLGAAADRAQRRGFTLATARGGELEGGFPYGVARQLFEPLLTTAGAGARERLLDGAAALAAPAVLEADAGSGSPESFAAIHGLYWLVANIASEGPVALLVDDAHWADAPTLNWLVYLARRLDGLAATVIVSARTGEAGVEPRAHAALVDLPGTRVAAPATLSQAGVARVLAEDFGRAPASELVRACCVATAGNPFFVHELAAALQGSGVEPDAEASALVLETGPPAIARSILTRLGHFSDDAVALTRAIAVLGNDATLPRAASLAGLDEHAALRALDALLATGLVDAAERLRFAHPIVRSAIYDELAPGERSIAHGRAAAMLAAEGAPVDTSAAHALLTTPTGSAQTIAMLRQAAAHALAVGAPENATAYLTRALEEGCERELRATMLLEVALAEKLARNPAALGRLEEARRAATEPIGRATALVEQCDLLTYAGHWKRARAVLEEGLAELDGRAPHVALHAHIMGALLSAYDPRMVADFDRRLPELLEIVRRGDAGTAPLAQALAGVLSNRGAPVATVRELVAQGWEEGRCLSAPDVAVTLPQAICALLVIEDFEGATRLTEGAIEAGRQLGSTLFYLHGRGHSALIESRRGNLAAAVDDLRFVVERALELGWPFAVLAVLGYCSEVLLERPDAADIAQIALTVELGSLAEVTAGAMLGLTRGRLLHAAGRSAEAIAEMRRAGAIAAGVRMEHPNSLLAWRSALALMLPREDRAEALELAAVELDRARRLAASARSAHRRASRARPARRGLRDPRAHAGAPRARASARRARRRAAARRQPRERAGPAAPGTRPCRALRSDQARRKRSCRARRDRRATAARTSQRPRGAHAERGSRRAPSGRRAHEPRDRPGALRHDQDRRRAPRPRLYEARHRLATRARRSARRRRRRAAGAHLIGPSRRVPRIKRLVAAPDANGCPRQRRCVDGRAVERASRDRASPRRPDPGSHPVGKRSRSSVPRLARVHEPARAAPGRRRGRAAAGRHRRRLTQRSRAAHDAPSGRRRAHTPRNGAARARH